MRIILFFVLTLFLSCKTAPETSNAVLEETELIPLEAGALVYLFADVKAARPILELVPIAELGEKQVAQMIDRTTTMAAALFPSESGRRFQAVAWGAYPSLGVSLAFGMNNNWKKHRSQAGFSYWYSAKDRLSVAVNSKQAFVSAMVTDTPIDPVTTGKGIESPEGFDEFRHGAILSCWLEEPGDLITRIIQASGIPLNIPAERAFISLFPAGEGLYEAMLRIQVAGTSQARALFTLFSLARAFIPAEAAGVSEGNPATVLASILFANPPSLNGRDLNIRTAVLSEREMALLFNLFSAR